MCGIVGMIGKVQAAPHLFDGLTRLQYRGYDSAGIATLVDGRIERRRAQGKLSNLAAMLEQQPLQGTIGIGHTRWATHGRPSEINAHPHATEKVAIVHNGIIENFQELRNELEALGMRMTSETDTEVVAHLLTHLLECGYSPSFVRHQQDLYVVDDCMGVLYRLDRSASLAEGWQLPLDEGSDLEIFGGIGTTEGIWFADPEQTGEPYFFNPRRSRFEQIPLKLKQDARLFALEFDVYPKATEGE